MYIEDKSSGIKMSSSDDVNEATAALKGMLGIGSPIVESSTSTVPEKKEQEEEPPEKPKKKKQNKKKKKKDNTPKKQQQQDGGSNKKKGAKGKQDTAEKFAWSAFQASPDASSLPLPAFSPPTKSKRSLNRETASALSDAPPIVPETNRGEELATTSSNAEGAKDEVDDKNVVETEKTDDDTTPEIETKSKDPGTVDETPVSSTGINLAALASPAQSSQTAPSTPSATHQPDPNIPQVPYPNNAYQQPPPLPPVYNNASPQAQVQFVTIQVQVPPGLLPGRQMVVASPMGYPVHVRVPEGVPPGAVIPVHVPIGPPPPQQQPAQYGNNPYPYGHPLHRR